VEEDADGEATDQGEMDENSIETDENNSKK
jgi:hypothetical protein